MHPIENYRLIHKDDSDEQLRLLKQATLPDSPEYLAVVSLLDDRASQREAAKIEREDIRFLAQLNETQRQGSLTRRIALAALAVSVISVFLSQCRKSASQDAVSSQPVSQLQSLSQTNSTSAGKVSP
jgi:hypothetical protein